MDTDLSLNNLIWLVGLAVGLGIFAYQTFSKQTAEQKRQRLITIQDLAMGSYLWVHSFSGKTATSVDDKIAEALKKVAETIATQTGKPLTGAEIAAATAAAQVAASKAKLQDSPK